jgi:hypothetical protein
MLLHARVESLQSLTRRLIKREREEKRSKNAKRNVRALQEPERDA